MKILVYVCPEAPPQRRALAIYTDGGTPLPVHHYGPDPDALRTKAQAWWDDAAAKAQAKAARPKKQKPQPVEDPGDII